MPDVGDEDGVVSFPAAQAPALLEAVRTTQANEEAIKAEITTGEVVVVCGPSGSDKSTLIRTVNLLEEIQKGTIEFDGTDVHGRGVDMNRFRSRVGFVLQSFNLFQHLSVADNFMLGQVSVLRKSRADVRARTLQLLDRVGLASKVDAYPGQLSGGQQQRVAIARALAMDPPAMLFDEPTSALDPEMVVMRLSQSSPPPACGISVFV